MKLFRRRLRTYGLLLAVCSPVAGRLGHRGGNRQAFSAIKGDGSITAWGSSSHGGTGAPIDTGYSTIFFTDAAFAAMKDGLITTWGSSSHGGTGAPIDAGYTTIFLG